MLNKAIKYLKRLRSMQRINVSLSRGALGSFTRSIDLTNPKSWEFSAFSQNGEDGIVDVLTSKIKRPNRYFIEIGSADGIENNTSYLALVKRFNGLMIEGSKKLADECSFNINYLCNVKCICMFVNQENLNIIKRMSPYAEPDLLSLDIDGNDYWIAKVIMELGFRPKIFVVEYNSAFGPQESLTIEYKEDFKILVEHLGGLYYGVSLSGWKKFFNMFGYKFISVESNGVNAFFVKIDEFDEDFLKNINGLEFAENLYQRITFSTDWTEQFKLIEHMKFIQI